MYEYGETKSKYQSIEEVAMTVRIEKKGKVWTVIHSRPQARNAMDPESADALVEAFTAFDRDADAAVAVLWGEGGAFCAGWDLKYCGSLVEDPTLIHDIDYPLDDRHLIPRGPLGPTRLELDKPVIAAVAGPAVAGGFELALWGDVRVMEESAYVGVYRRRRALRLRQGAARGFQGHLAGHGARQALPSRFLVWTLAFHSSRRSRPAYAGNPGIVHYAGP